MSKNRNKMLMSVMDTPQKPKKSFKLGRPLFTKILRQKVTILDTDSILTIETQMLCVEIK